jgi:hypothetical protein
MWSLRSRGRHRPVKTDLTYTLPLVETWEACRTWYTPPTTWQRLRLWLGVR